MFPLDCKILLYLLVVIVLLDRIGPTHERCCSVMEINLANAVPVTGSGRMRKSDSRGVRAWGMNENEMPAADLDHNSVDGIGGELPPGVGDLGTVDLDAALLNQAA